MSKSIVSRSLVLTALLLLAPTVAAAHELPAQASILDNVLEELTIEWWQQMYRLPTVDRQGRANPLTERGEVDCMRVGVGPVRFLAGVWSTLFEPVGDEPGIFGGAVERSCTIRAGTALLVPVINAEQSAIEAVAFGASGTAGSQLTDFARYQLGQALIDPLPEHPLSLTIDGVQVPATWLRRVQTRVFEFRLPGDNIFGFDLKDRSLPNPSQASADGIYALLPPLPRGEHVIEFGGSASFPALSPPESQQWGGEFSGGFGFFVKVRYVITVR